jgi:DNA-directed RNA polymerase delta subunit
MKKISQNFINEILEKLFKKINKRSAEILKARFGLEKTEKQSLGKIGDNLKITRERVRQIEVVALKQLKEFKKEEDFKLIIEKSLEIIEKHGGVALNNVIAESLITNISLKTENKLMFILNCSKKIIFNKATLRNNSFWSLNKGIKSKKVNDFNDFVIKELKKNKKSIKIKDVEKIISGTEWEGVFFDKNSQKKLTMFLLISKDLKRNLLGEWGIKNWRSVSERGNKEKAYLVLKKKNKPLHFRMITEHINIYWKKKKSLSQTVHNELIKDDRFVLVGRGTYGLSEWGLKGGTVKEIIVSLFEEKPNPLHIDEIVEYVLSHKEVKKTTILVNLSNQKYFIKKRKSYYFIK